MRRGHLIGVLIVGTGLGAAGCVQNSQAADPAQQLREATLTVGDGRCAGVVVGDRQHAFTAAHCLSEGERALSAELFDGQKTRASIEMVDRDADVVVLRFAEPLPVRPLRVAAELPEPGALVLFQGRNDFGGELQWAEVRKLGRCPSLPTVPDALFTTLVGQKGDSGAPVVDEQLQVVGLVHGGAACHIAAPTAEFAPLVEDLSGERASR